MEAMRQRHREQVDEQGGRGGGGDKRTSRLELMTGGRGGGRQLAMDQEMEKRGTRTSSLDR